MVFYIIIRGPLGCGKSTIAKRLARRLSATYISVDKILDVHHLTTQREAGYISQQSFLTANEIAITSAKKSLRTGKVVIFDGNFYWPSQLQDLIAKLDYPHYVFTSLCSTISRHR